MAYYTPVDVIKPFGSLVNEMIILKYPNDVVKLRLYESSRYVQSNPIITTNHIALAKCIQLLDLKTINKFK